MIRIGKENYRMRRNQEGIGDRTRESVKDVGGNEHKKVERKSGASREILGKLRRWKEGEGRTGKGG